MNEHPGPRTSISARAHGHLPLSREGPRCPGEEGAQAVQDSSGLPRFLPQKGNWLNYTLNLFIYLHFGYTWYWKYFKTVENIQKNRDISHGSPDLRIHVRLSGNTWLELSSGCCLGAGLPSRPHCLPGVPIPGPSQGHWSAWPAYFCHYCPMMFFITSICRLVLVGLLYWRHLKVFNLGASLPPWDIWQRLELCLVVTLGVGEQCYWCLVG